ncbi:MAG TPA: riboflavin biosynthesis protein RibD, partial [Bacteroidales bacterium]
NNIQSLLVEGGAKTLQSFIDSSLWDEAYMETGTQSFGDGVAAPVLSNACLQSEPKLVDHHLLMHYRKS